jgi:hypothetical protein
MMVTIWIRHRELDNQPTDADFADMQIISEQYDQATNQHLHYDDYDYDPWAPINHRSTPTPDTTPSTTPNTRDTDNPAVTLVTKPAGNDDPSLEDRFPRYPWNNADMQADPKLKLNIVDGAELDGLHRCRYQTKKVNDKGLHTSSKDVPVLLWHPLSEWISETCWTDLATEKGIKSAKLGHNASWIELTIAFQYQTGHSIIAKKASLDEQVDCFKAAFTRLLQHKKTNIYNGNKATTFRTAFKPAQQILTTAILTGAATPGIHRRPIWSAAAAKIVATNVHQHHEHACTLSANATEDWVNDYVVAYPATRPKWTPLPITQLYQMIQERREKIAQDNLACDQDSKSSTNNRSNTPTDHQHDTITSTTTSAVTSNHKGTKRNNTCKQGPCHFGHTTSSLRANGQVRWTANPDPTFWPEIPVGATLCQKCYNLGWRQRTKDGLQHKRLPTQYQPCQVTGDTGKGKPRSNTDQAVEPTASTSPAAAPPDDNHAHPTPPPTTTFDCDSPVAYNSLCNTDATTNADGNYEGHTELPSSSKRRRCSVRLQIGCAIRHAKSLSLLQTADETRVIDSSTEQRPPRSMLRIGTGRSPDRVRLPTTNNTPPTTTTTPPPQLDIRPSSTRSRPPLATPHSRPM